MVIDINKIRKELSNVGIEINDIYDLVNTNNPYPLAIPVLLDLLQIGIEDIKVKEGVVRALAVKEAIGKAGPILIEQYNKISKKEMMLRWAIGNTLYKTIAKDDVENILKIVQDKSNGISRQMFVASLGKIPSENAENVLINLLEDNEVAAYALEALGKMKSIKTKEKITILTEHSNSLIRKEAQKALKKINK